MSENSKKTAILRKRAEGFLAAIPYSVALGITLRNFSEARVCLEMPWHEDLIGDPSNRVIHGGAVSTLLDTCAGAAVMAHPSTLRSMATLDLRIDYMRPAIPGNTIRADAHCYHMTRHIAFVKVIAQDSAKEVPVATAAANFTIVHHHEEAVSEVMSHE